MVLSVLCEFHWGFLRRFFMGSNSFLHKFPWSSLGFLVNHSVPLVFPTQTKKSMDIFTFILQLLDISESVEKDICHQASKTVILKKQIFYTKTCSMMAFSSKFIETNFSSLMTDGFFN